MEAIGPVSSSPTSSIREAPLRLAPRPGGWWDLNRMLVTLYKVFGFGVLTVILLGLIGYFGVNLFYLFDHHWILPAIISPTDDRVLQLGEQFAEQEALRQKLVVQGYDLKARLLGAARTIEVENRFQGRFDSAVQGDVEARRAELKRLRDLFADYGDAKQEILKSSQAYAGLSRERSEEMMKAHLLQEDNYLTTNYELSQIAHSNLTLAQSEVSLSSRADELEHEIRAMENAHRRTSGASPLSYELLRMEQEYYRSMLEAAKARDEQEAVEQSLAAIDESIRRYDHMLKSIQDSPYLQAVEHHLSVAFLPYENEHDVEKGSRLYACRFGLIGCSLVGRLGQTLDGEVNNKHPLHNQVLRGVMVELDLTNPSWARQKVLFANRPPLLF